MTEIRKGNSMRKRQYLMPVACITILFIIIYHQYIWGDKLFMFTDIGFDTISIIHPFADFITKSHFCDLNKYSFQIGLGSGVYSNLISAINPAQAIMYAIPAGKVAYLGIISMYISTVISGVLAIA